MRYSIGKIILNIVKFIIVFCFWTVIVCFVQGDTYIEFWAPHIRAAIVLLTIGTIGLMWVHKQHKES